MQTSRCGKRTRPRGEWRAEALTKISLDDPARAIRPRLATAPSSADGPAVPRAFRGAGRGPAAPERGGDAGAPPDARERRRVAGGGRRPEQGRARATARPALPAAGTAGTTAGHPPGPAYAAERAHGPAAR